MPQGGRGDVAVFDGHTLAGLVEQPFLISLYVCDGYVEPVNSSLECFHKPRQPGLQDLTLASILGAHPVGQLGDDDGACIAAVLLLFEPRDIGVEQPVHNFRRRAGARRRRGTSSGLTGQALSTASQLSLPGSRRNTSAPSSESKRASK